MANDDPHISCESLAEGSRVCLQGDWSTLNLAPHVKRLQREMRDFSAAHRWDLSGLTKLDHTGALLLWRIWDRSLPAGLQVSAAHEPYFARLSAPKERPNEPGRAPWTWRSVPTELGRGLIGAANAARDIVTLCGQMLLDVADLAVHPTRWPLREICAGIYRAGAQAIGILALVGFLIGVVLSYLTGDQLRKFGAESFVVNLLGVGCTRELGPLLAAILVAGRSGSAMTAQLGVMRLNEELDALTTVGIRYSQRLILPKVIALVLAQPLAGLWTTAVEIVGGMMAAHMSLGVGYYYFLDTLPKVVKLSNYWIGLGKGAVFGGIIALIACYFGLKIKPNTESLGAGTTSSVVISISSVLIADALFAVLFSHLGL